MPESRALLRHLRISPPKVREVLGLIRGREIDDARERLRFCERGPAGEVLKLLDSAVANAESAQNVAEDELFVSRAYADEGPTLKRWRPRARGRGTRIRKRTSHVTIIVARFSDDELDLRRRREGGAPSRLRRPTRRRRIRREAEPDEELEGAEEEMEGADELELEAAEEAEGVDIDERDDIDEGDETEEGGAPEPAEPAKKARATKKPATKKATTAKKPTAKKAKTTKKTTKKKGT
jgi:large subunit ribosomal protein L22